MKLLWSAATLYLLGVGAAAWIVGTKVANQGTPHVTAARDLPAEHFLQLSDLVPVDHEKITHKYLRHKVQRGAQIVPGDVMEKPPVKARVNSLALVLNVKATKVAGLVSGAKAPLCKAGKAFAEQATVVDYACGVDKGNCLLSVAIAQPLKDPQSLSDLDKVELGSIVPPACPPTAASNLQKK
jgi:hypothetical protein